MKRFSLFASATAIGLFAASCGRDAGLNLPETPASYDEVVFRTNRLDADVMTRTSAVSTLTSFYVAAATGTAGESDQYVWEGGQAAFTGNGTYTGGKYWPYSDPEYHFYASNTAMNTSDNSAASVTVGDNSTDVVCAYLATSTHKAVNTLAFCHIFARLGTVTVSSNATGYDVTALSLSLTPKTGGTYDLLSGDGKTDDSGWTATTESGQTTIAAKTGQTDNDLYLVPGSYTVSATYTLSKGAYSHEFTKTATINLIKGKINKVAATLPMPGPEDDAGEITLGITVSDWTDNSISVDF